MAFHSISWVGVTSSNISQVAYDDNTKTLIVQFSNGGLYSYSNVDHDIFVTMQSVPSVGRYFNMMVKAVHDYQKWTSEPELLQFLKDQQAA